MAYSASISLAWHDARAEHPRSDDPIGGNTDGLVSELYLCLLQNRGAFIVWKTYWKQKWWKWLYLFRVLLNTLLILSSFILNNSFLDKFYSDPYFPNEAMEVWEVKGFVQWHSTSKLQSRIQTQGLTRPPDLLCHSPSPRLCFQWDRESATVISNAHQLNGAA